MTTHSTAITTFILTLGSAAVLIASLLFFVSRDQGLVACLSNGPVAQVCSVRGGCSGTASRATAWTCGSPGAALAQKE